MKRMLEMEKTENNVTIWREPKWMWGAWAGLLFLLYLPFKDGLEYMYSNWTGKDEYSHAVIIPFIAMFLIWQKKDELEQIPFKGSFVGILFLLFGGFLYILGELSSLYVIIQYSFVIVLISLFYTVMGWRAFRKIAIPLAILFLMIPLPNFLYNNISSKLQLISSQIGVWFIRLFDIMVYVEGNVIDLGGYQLQVVEACNGLRYLFPLMALGFIMAYFYKSALWKRVFVFVTTIPLTVVMNSFRIGVIGITVEFWGQEMAEGFLHDFEGWVVFMICSVLLLLEMWLLVKFSRDKRSFREVFGLEFPAPSPDKATVKQRNLTLPYYCAATFVILIIAVSLFLSNREEMVPGRMIFTQYPKEMADWKGSPRKMEQTYIDALKFEDYILSNYYNSENQMVNFYVAYYDSQRKGESVHSPKSCLPGSGAAELESGIAEVPGVQINGEQLKVNRYVISDKGQTSLIYYWFQQRGRVITSEYMVKWWLFADSILKNRSDGSLVRITISVPENREPSEMDPVLADFTKQIATNLSDYVPD